MIGELYEAFNRRDFEAVAAMCDPNLEFLPVTARSQNEGEAYRGLEGLRRYFEHVEEAWDELLITAERAEARGEWILVTGRVRARSKDAGIRDLPAGWLWRVRGGRFVSGLVFEDPSDAEKAFAER